MKGIRVTSSPFPQRPADRCQDTGFSVTGRCVEDAWKVEDKTKMKDA